MSGNTTVRAGHDAWVEENHPNASHAATVNLQVGQPANQHAQAFIYFHQPAPRGATIKEAVLRFYTRNAWGAGNHTLHITRIGHQWNHGNVTWNTRPGVTGGVITHTQTADAAFTLWEIDVSRHVQTMANGAANFGWRIHSDDTQRRQIVSLNAGSHKPTLQVIWSDAPQAPTNLVPSHQAVSISNPVLQFDYVDVAGGDDVIGVHVQIAGDETHGPVWQHPPAGNIHWDSGPVPADEAELDLAEPVPNPALGAATYPGLNPDMVRYWRVRVQASSGLWSRWSARADGVGARMVRRTKGTLQLLSPTGGRVDDFTPVVGWEFTGREMSHWRITIVDPDDPTNEYWPSGIRKGTLDNQNRFWFTLPSRALQVWGRQYRIRVDVWDFQQDRVRTPGDTPWVRVIHDFTLMHTPGVAPPTNLAGASDPDGMPYMHLSWRRANTPDGWRILRGDRLIREFDGPDLATGTPGLYRWTDRDATPNRTHTWTVRAVELHPDPNHERQTSPPATWTGQIHTDHAWLVDWDSDRIVAILDPDVTFEMPDTSATYEPIASDRVIRVTAQQRGMQGSVAGRLVGFEDLGGRTLEQWRENFVWMKRHPGRDYQLMTGNQSWRVHIGDAVISPMRIPRSQAVDVSFSFWSLDGPPQP